jgi:hypothetical protein
MEFNCFIDIRKKIQIPNIISKYVKMIETVKTQFCKDIKKLN